MTPPSGLLGSVAELDGADALERRREAELEELERHRRLQPLDELVRRDDDHEPRGRGGDRLLARVGRAAALHDPPRRRDLVGPVDRDVELVRARPTPENDSTASPSSRAASSVASDVATQRSDSPRPRERGKQVRDGRAGPEPDAHSVLDELGCRLRGELLLPIARHGRDPADRDRGGRRSALDRDVGRRVRGDERPRRSRTAPGAAARSSRGRPSAASPQPGSAPCRRRARTARRDTCARRRRALPPCGRRRGRRRRRRQTPARDDLPRLEDRVAVREDDGRRPSSRSRASTSSARG